MQWSSTASDIGVNKGIQLVAQRYCVECKTIYAELSKIIQNVLASRKELVRYDTHKGEERERGGGAGGQLGGGSPCASIPQTPSPLPSPVVVPAVLNVSGRGGGSGPWPSVQPILSTLHTHTHTHFAIKVPTKGV